MNNFIENAVLRISESFNPTYSDTKIWNKYVNSKICDAIDDMFGELPIATRHQILIRFEEVHCRLMTDRHKEEVLNESH